MTAAIVLLLGVAIVLWFLSASNADAVRAMTDDELRAEIEECHQFFEDASFYEAELARRAQMEAVQ
jgi:hypothetical protein